MDCPEWDSFIQDHQHGWVCHTSEWYKVGQQIWKKLTPFYIVVRDLEKNCICSALPLCLIRSRFGKYRLISPPFSTLTDVLTTSEPSLQYLYRNLPMFLQEKKVTSVVLKTFKSSDSVPLELFYRKDYFVHHGVDLSLSSEDLMKSFNRSNVRNRIKKAIKSPLEPTYAESMEEVREFYGLVVENRHILGLPSMPWKFFEGVWQQLYSRDWVELALIRHEEKLVGGLLSLKFKHRISAEVLAYRRDYLPMCPTHLLFWSTMNKAKDEGIQEFDFGRTSVTNTSLLRFKDHWGAKKTILPVFTYPKNRTIHYQGNNPVMTLLRSTLRHLPQSVYEELSRIFYLKPR